MARATRSARFTTNLLDGHKGHALEIPFDPAERWGTQAQTIRKGRKGHPVRGTVDGVEIESAVVARSKRWFLLVDEVVRRDAGIDTGDQVMVSIAPMEIKAPKHTSARDSRTGARALALVRALVAALPQTAEKLAWGAPTFRVHDKMFAAFHDGHHGDERVSLWCKAPAGVQQTLVLDRPLHFFVPAYVGKAGWVGIDLGSGLERSALAALLEQAWRMTAPKRLLASFPQPKSR